MLLFAVASVGMAGCSVSPAPAPAPSPSAVPVQGSVIVPRIVRSTISASGVAEPVPVTNGSPCEVKQGFTDIHEGASVNISDAAGETVGVTPLSSATVIGFDAANPFSGECLLSFTVDDLPDSPSYAVTVGAGQRGAVQFTEQEARDGGFRIKVG